MPENSNHTFHSFVSGQQTETKRWIIVSPLKIHTCDCLCVWADRRSVMFSPDRHFSVSDASVRGMPCVECMPTNNVFVSACVCACSWVRVWAKRDVVHWQWRAPGCWILEMTLNLSILHSHGCRDGEHVCTFVHVCLRGRTMRLCTLSARKIASPKFCNTQLKSKYFQKIYSE